MANKLEHSKPGMMGSKRMLQRDPEPSRYVKILFCLAFGAMYLSISCVTGIS